MHKLASIAMVVLFAGVCAAADDGRPEPQPENTNLPAKADNSARNTRERDAGELNPADQKQNSSDLELTRKIRRAVVDDKTLSTYAHNVKIIAQDGVVNLKGPVRSEVEKNAVEKKAADIAGADHVKSQLEVAP